MCHFENAKVANSMRYPWPMAVWLGFHSISPL